MDLIDLDLDSSYDEERYGKFKVRPEDIRTEGFDTVEEYMLFKYSSNYQTMDGGVDDINSIFEFDQDK